MLKPIMKPDSAQSSEPGFSSKGHPPASVAPAGGRTLGADREIRPH
jgi:hypothetical protein